MTTDWRYSAIGLFLAAGCFNFFVYFRDHRHRRYAADKTTRITSPATFRFWEHYLRVTTLGFSLAGVFGRPHALVFFDSTVLVALSGAAAIVVGASLLAWSKATLGNAYSPCYDSFVPNDFVATGPYCFVRHPIYTANTITLAGAFLLSGSAVILINGAILLFFYRRAAIAEEQALSGVFPAYRTYLEHTGRFFPKIP